MHEHNTKNHRGRLIRSLCLRRGLPLGELARRAGVSRTTLHHLTDGSTQRPHSRTVSKIAAVLDVDPELLGGGAPAEAESDPPAEARSTPARRDGRLAFDRATNTVVSEVYSENPRLFGGWSAEEWAELYSTFGTGGQLSRQGVVEVAHHVNEKRHVVRKLQVVLETHLGEVAANMIETLFEMVRAGDGGDEPPADARAVTQSEHPDEAAPNRAARKRPRKQRGARK